MAMGNPPGFGQGAKRSGGSMPPPTTSSMTMRASVPPVPVTGSVPPPHDSIFPPTQAPEIILPFPKPLDRLPLASQFRSTWLSSSLRALRERGYFERYLQNLPPEFHAAVLESVAGMWHPTRVAEAHYAACDTLDIPTTELVEIGKETTRRVHETTLSVAVRAARGVEMTPWTIFGMLNRLWDRVWMGGGCEVVKLGPKEARVTIAAWPCARFTYTRGAMRGVMLGLVDLCSAKVYVREDKRLCTDTAMGFRLSWV